MINVSVIIPVYNVEQYLRKCLDSICNQTLKNIEIICVNDCSPDNSLAILQEYAQADSRIKIVNREQNGGLAAARNSGLEVAQGEYVAFVDSDDYISLDFCEKLYLASDNGKFDIVKGADIHVVYNNGKVDVWPQNEEIRKNKINFYAQVTTAIYKLDFLKKNDIKFYENIRICEDIVFIAQCAICANSLKVIDDGIYYYLRRDDSLDTEKYDSAKVGYFIEHIRMISSFLEKYDVSLNDKKIILTRMVAQIDTLRKHKVEANSEDYAKLTALYQQKVVQKMRLR